MADAIGDEIGKTRAVYTLPEGAFVFGFML